jgi:GNAT superfamily N-acetyltransferase
MSVGAGGLLRDGAFARTVSASPDRRLLPEEKSLLARSHENFIEAFRHFARGSPRCRIAEEKGVIRIASGMSTSAFNIVFVMRPVEDPDVMVSESRDFMRRAGVTTWRLVSVGGAAASLASTLSSDASLKEAKVPGMLLTPVPALAPQLPNGFRIEPASTPELWNTMLNVGMQGMGDPWEHVEWVLPYESSGRVRGYLGYEGQRPVATSLGFSHAGLGGVFFVATLPEVRGRGYGTAMTWQAITGARDEGCLTSCLQASKAGYPVYRKMGYRDVVEYSQWRFEAPAVPDVPTAGVYGG